MADACLSAIGVATSAEAVGRHYGSPLLDGWLVDSSDEGASVPGVQVRAVPLLMSSPEATKAMGQAVLDLAVSL
jgi:LPPG:FO 2-phospho-L-lactate transferase